LVLCNVYMYMVLRIQISGDGACLHCYLDESDKLTGMAASVKDGNYLV